MNLLSVQSAGDHYSSDPVQVQSRSEGVEQFGLLFRTIAPSCLVVCALWQLMQAACGSHAVNFGLYCSVGMLGTRVPSKIRIVTLMRPIHGNL